MPYRVMQSDWCNSQGLITFHVFAEEFKGITQSLDRIQRATIWKKDFVILFFHEDRFFFFFPTLLEIFFLNTFLEFAWIIQLSVSIGKFMLNNFSFRLKSTVKQRCFIIALLFGCRLVLSCKKPFRDTEMGIWGYSV